MSRTILTESARQGLKHVIMFQEKPKVNFIQISLCSGNLCYALLSSIGRQSVEYVEIEKVYHLGEQYQLCEQRTLILGLCKQICRHPATCLSVGIRDEGARK